MSEKGNALTMPLHSVRGNNTFMNLKISVKNIFFNIYEDLNEKHPTLFMIFLIVGIPAGVIGMLAFISIVVISPFALIFGW